MIYTAITGQKDQPRSDVKVFGEYARFKSPVLNAKVYKVLSHLFVEDGYSVWVDGNIFVNVPEEKLVEDFLKEHDIAVFRHPYRKTIYEEGGACRCLDDPNIITEQLASHPNIEGLAECGMIIRRHTEEIKRLNEKWWAEICRYSVRDQLSFPYVFKKVNYINGNVREHPYFRYEKHNF